MSATPVTRYAPSAGVHLAYQVFGAGPVDLIVFGATASNVELIWDNPSARRFLERLGTIARVIMFDKRGTGLSDQASIERPPTLEERLSDLGAVLDAAEADDEIVLFGQSEGTALGVMFAAAQPERARALITYGGFARTARTDDYPEGLPEAALDSLLDTLPSRWGTAEFAHFVLPSVTDAEAEWWATYLRSGSSPGSSAAQIRMNYPTDVSDLLPLVQCPTLVMHAEDEQFIRASAGKYLADRIPHARWVPIPGGDHLPYAGASDAVFEEIEDFLTGHRRAIEPDRMLATVLFSDIVDSTATAATHGDRAWRLLLDRHDDMVRDELGAFGGDEVKHTGDGFLATFPGPGQAVRCG